MYIILCMKWCRFAINFKEPSGFHVLKRTTEQLKKTVISTSQVLVQKGT